MSRILPRYTNTAQADQQQIARILLETGEASPVVTVTRATLPGDNRRLRGIPVVARGVAGVSPNTDPWAETARRLTRR